MLEELKYVTFRDHTVNLAKFLQRQYGNYGGTYDMMKKIKPTFGISFGLPHQGGGGYPINPHGHPFPNPYGGSIGSTGINLGLVSVNPLISVQVTKDDHGNKEIKPFVNLHLTPNSFLVNKFEDLLHYKKAVIFNKHKHFHVHKGHLYPHHEQFYPDHHYEHPYKFHHSPPHDHYGFAEYPEPSHYDHDHYHKPHYSSGHQFEHHGYDEGPQYSHYPEYGSYYDDPLNYGGGDYKNDYYGRAYLNKTNNGYAEGNSLLEQYQDQYDNGIDSYASSSIKNDGNSNDFFTNSGNSRRGKNLNIHPTSLNPVKFPSNRKRRDLSGPKTEKNITKV